MANESHVFHDPAGKRWSLFTRVWITLALLFSVAGVLLCVTILLLPAAHANILGTYKFQPFNFHRTKKAQAEQLFQAERSRARLMADIAKEDKHRIRHSRGSAQAYDTVIGFYVNWEPNSFTSLRQHIDNLTYVMPEWLSLTNDNNLFSDSFIQPSSDTTSHDSEMVALANAHHVPIVPILNNAADDDFRWPQLQLLLRDPVRQQQLIMKLRDYLLAKHYAGINIDFEPPYDLMTDAQVAGAHELLYTAMPQFMQRLHAVFSPVHLLVTQDVPALDANFDYDTLTDLNDLIIVMLYDQHTPADTPGPIAAQSWIEDAADTMFRNMDTSKVIIGLGNYCYDWPITLDQNGNMQRAGAGRELLLGSALNIAKQARVPLAMDDGDLNPYFTYRDAGGQTHVMYLLDAVTAFNTLKALRGYEPRGAALWYMGSEDPTIWSFLNDDTLGKAELRTPPLQVVDYQNTLDADAEHHNDELMQIVAVSEPGKRQFTLDDDGLIASETYAPYPSPYVMRQFDSDEKALAITFDDGPDPRYTPQLLDILRQTHTPATFFVVGEKASKYPWIIQREWNEGHEIGNHTYTHPHIALVSPFRAELELNATQRIIESLTGHMTLLFRPPYGDSPDSNTIAAADIPLLLQMYRDQFMTVGMNIDPEDYLLKYETGPEKGQPKTAQSIVDDVVAQLGPRNHILLLHDSGGDRVNTVKALPMIIHELRARGYHLTSVSGLIGVGWHARLFPPVAKNQAPIAGFDRIVFNIWYFFGMLISVAFLLAIGLGMLRLLVFGVLALLQHRRIMHRVQTGNYLPTVNVAIPAYNEGNVIVRTIASVLASEYPALHIFVVDDGSTDDTAENVRAQFGTDARVTLIRKANGGKATALNVAFAAADAEIVVCMDADTMFTPQTIRRLVQPFVELQVGAVAGNVKVGNRVNLLAIWQSLEYITSQNFDRLAFARLNSVAVVPGAVGAWRRAAVLEVGGFESNTLAEDTDLTFKIRLAGYYTRAVNSALAYTETPATVSSLAKQRFRWAFGILQALWKHRRRLFDPKYGAFTLVVMPSMWIYNIFLQALAPIVDIAVVVALCNHQFIAVLYYTAVFFVLDLMTSLIAFRLDQENPMQLAWLFLQRFFYRQFMYYIIVRALLTAMRGSIVGWGKLHRNATVSLPGQ